MVYDTIFPKARHYHEFIRNDSIITIVYDLAGEASVGAIGIYTGNEFFDYGIGESIKQDFSPDEALQLCKES